MNFSKIAAAKKYLMALLFISTFVVISGCDSGSSSSSTSDTSSDPIVAVADDDNMLIGNPDGAVTDVSSPNNYLMVKSQYCLSYNNSKLTTNWTSWHLDSGDLGVGRNEAWSEDTTLPAGWFRVQHSTYTSSGFSRGHMCPNADRTGSQTDSDATFIMTNMIPQNQTNNGGPWEVLEGYSRTLTSSSELYIICGPLGKGGKTSGAYPAVDTYKETIGPVGNQITVPAYTWKIVVVLPNGSNDLSRITTTTRVIAVKMPNDNTCTGSWSNYRVSVRSLEADTGFNFLSNVPQSIQDTIETKVDNL